MDEKRRRELDSDLRKLLRRDPYAPIDKLANASEQEIRDALDRINANRA